MSPCSVCVLSIQTPPAGQVFLEKQKELLLLGEVAFYMQNMAMAL